MTSFRHSNLINFCGSVCMWRMHFIISIRPSAMVHHERIHEISHQKTVSLYLGEGDVQPRTLLGRLEFTVRTKLGTIGKVIGPWPIIQYCSVNVNAQDKKWAWNETKMGPIFTNSLFMCQDEDENKTKNESFCSF